jgi:non-heme chloroperoxidase
MTAAATAARASPGTATTWTPTPTTCGAVETLDLKNAIMVGHSTGGGEVARYIGRHGTKRVAKAVLIGAVPPLMLKTAANPGGLPMRSSTASAPASLADRSQFFKDLTTPFYGFNRPGAKVSPRACATRSGCRACMAGFKEPVDCIKAFSETDFTEDLKKFDVPTLIITATTTRSCRSAPRRRRVIPGLNDSHTT